MCEQCEKIKEELWAEVSDLVNYNADERGPLSKALDRRVGEILSEPKFQMYAWLTEMDVRDSAADAAIEAMRCMMISQRLAFITTYGGSSRGSTAPTMVLGEWAGEMMQREMHFIPRLSEDDLSECGMPPMKFVREILGELIGDPENVEAEDA